ncbi:hypothetical protein SAMN02745132_01875 [Enterovibrio nigricans DSM 22720]|uniref:Uncharacterized protein n=1 Tax=Enterovibrio nigricans DSM 22720 TaxID=1121868 RepID=A0A1T4UJL6_9GAMM|nr:hypothetical protein SAMN02745132_01875 [Enterovibrio nigricans DSM 22720]
MPITVVGIILHEEFWLFSYHTGPFGICLTEIDQLPSQCLILTTDKR